MSWKDCKLCVKFGIGFGTVLLLLAVLSGWSIFGIDTIVQDAEEVIEGNKLRGNFTQRVVDHLKWAEKVNELLANADIHKLDVQTDPHKCAFGKWYYSEARTRAEELVPAIRPLLASIEKPHNALHASALTIEEKYAPADVALSSFLRDKKLDHLLWAGQIKDALLDPKSRTTGVQTDAHQCALGIWLYSDETKKRMQADPEFAKAVEHIFEPHMALHNSAIQINSSLAAGDHATAQRFFNQTTAPLAEETLAAINKVIKLNDDRIVGYEAAKEVFTTVTMPNLNEVQNILNNTMAVISENIMTDQAMLSEASNTLTIVMSVSAIAIVLGVILAWLLAKGIIGPLKKGMEFAEVVAKGDLTATVDLSQDDEVGQLAKSLTEMADKLNVVVGDVNGATESVSAGSEELSASAQSLSQSVTEQAASIEQISASMEKMNQSVRDNAQNASETERIASSAADNAEEGGKAVTEAMDALRSIAERITIIQEIARQTNLLALNAAIEAARAGEHGKGFAVVAAEVRKLAERSGQAAEEIGDLSNASVDVADKAANMLESLVPEIGKTAELVQEIAASCTEQDKGITEISTGVEHLDQVIQSNASASEEMASTSEELSAQAQLLAQAMTFFTVNHNGHSPQSSRTKVISSRDIAHPLADAKFNKPKTISNGIDMKLDADEFEQF